VAVLCTAALAVGVVGTYEAPDRSPQILLTNARFTAEAPELHDHVYKHLRTCASARSWVDKALHEPTRVRPRRIS
jgi:hypothetical protein